MSENITKQTIEKKIINIMENLIKSSSGISLSVPLAELNIDSIIFIKIVTTIEEEFDIEFDDEKLLITAFHNVKDIIDYLRVVKCI